MSVNLAPIGNGFQFFTNSGVPLSGGKIFTYQAGTSTPLDTYTDNTGGIPNSNPIILDSSGRCATEIWLTAGSAYKFVLTDSLNNTLGTFDNLKGINDIQGGTISGSLTIGGNLNVNGNTTIGDSSADLLTVNPNVISWPNNPTHSGNHTFTGLETFNVGAKVGNANQTDPATLDWYLEGSFTPTILFGGASVGVTYNPNTLGQYTRIGNTVFWGLRITLTSKGASVGNAQIGGLPYAASTIGEYVNGFDGTNLAGLSSSPFGIVPNLSQRITLVQWGTAGTSNLTDANFTNTTTLYASGVYQV